MVPALTPALPPLWCRGAEQQSSHMLSLVVSRLGHAEVACLPWPGDERQTTTMRMQCLDACSACVGGRGAWLLANAQETRLV